MLNEENKGLCREVLRKYGTANQMFKVIEECAELQEAISHAFQPDFDINAADQNLHEELVDVIVVCQQMLMAYQIDMDEVNTRAKAKLERALNERR